MNDTAVRFIGDDGVLSVLEVRATHDGGLLHQLVKRLYELRVQVVRSEAFVTAGQIVERLTVVEFDGAPIDQGRRRAIQCDVLDIVDRHRPGPVRATERRRPTIERRPAEPPPSAS